MRRRRISIYSRVQATASLKGPWRGEELSSGDESDEDGVDNVEAMSHFNYADSDLPTTFCGIPIRRQRSQQIMPERSELGFQQLEQPPTQLHIDTAASNNDNAETTPTQNIQNCNNNNNGTPSPWRNSKAKQHIITELKDDVSDIHLLIGDYDDNNFKNVNFVKIHQKYADTYKLSQFRENMKRLLRNFRSETGPFKPETIVVEPWYTSVNNVSRGYALLYSLHIDPQKSHTINAMTVEELWESHPEFQKYALDKFKTYNINMKKLTDKKKMLIRYEEAAYHEDMLTLPHATTTSQGYPFWNKHRASKLLEEDETSGVAREMKPQQLWKSRVEYQDFPLAVFRKHIYQERMKQLAAPYWQYKRNKNAKKRFEEVEEMMKEWHQAKFNKSMEGLIADWDNTVHIRDE